MKKHSKELKPLKIRDRKEIISKINTEWESGMKEINRIKIQISSMEQLKFANYSEFYRKYYKKPKNKSNYIK